MFRHSLAALACALLATTTAAADPSDRPYVGLGQAAHATGGEQRAHAGLRVQRQPRQGSRATVWQGGTNNSTTVRQRGDNKTVIVVQRGSDTDVTIDQHGDGPGGAIVYTW